MPQIQHWIRSFALLIATVSTLTFSTLAFSTLALSTLAAPTLAAPTLAAPTLAATPTAAEILSVAAVTGDLSIEVSGDPAVEPPPLLELRYVASGGTVVDAVAFLPAPGDVQTLTLNGEFTNLASRGWQHRLEIVDADGALVDLLDLRLGLECQDELSSCEVVARPGVRIDNVVAVPDTLASHLGGKNSVDLWQLALAEPELLAAISEAAVDLETDIPGPSTGERCFYLYTASAGVQLDFRCFETEALIPRQVVTSAGVMQIIVPVLAPGPGEGKYPPSMITIVLGPDEVVP